MKRYSQACTFLSEPRVGIVSLLITYGFRFSFRKPIEMELNDANSHLRRMVEEELKSLGYRNNIIKMSRGTSVGDNYLAVITLVDINANTPEGEPTKLHWIAKCAHQNKQFRQNIKVYAVYSREIYMYTEVLPAFEQLQKINAVSEPFKEYPHFITSTMEEMHETIIMENLKAKGYIMKNRREPLDYTHTKYVITHYAKYHALSFALRDQHPEKFEEIAKITQTSFFDDSSREAMEVTMNSTCTRAIKAFTEDDQKELELLRYLEKYCYDVLEYSCRGSEAGQHGVIIHGDSWINNMLFRYEVRFSLRWAKYGVPQGSHVRPILFLRYSTIY